MGEVTPVAVAILYGAVLFLVAHRVGRGGMGPRAAAIAYPLSLCVYFTSWTFFGAVGSAAISGWDFLAIYLGPALVFLAAPAFLTRLVRLSQAEGANSISDFISARYGRSRRVAALVAALALAAAIPYVALQLRSVSWSFGALAGIDRSATTGFVVTACLAMFAISFGARSYEVSGRSQGVIAAIAVESAVKLLALLVLGIFALLLFLGADEMAQRAGAAALSARFAPGPLRVDFLVQILLSAAAIVCLPRQFYVGIVEAAGPDSIRRARWPFLLALMLVVAVVLPLALAGVTLLGGTMPPDLYVLGLPMAAGYRSIAMIAFLGGLSAATAMVIVETLALSTMAANDLLAPLLLRSRRVRSEADLGRLLLNARRIIIVLIVLAAFAYGEAITEERMLATIGLIAFAGVAQFAPALVATVLWGFADARAARAGLAGGFILWAWCLFLPSLGALPAMTGGPLDPQALLGFGFGSPLVHGVVWSLGVNIALMLLAARFGAARSSEEDEAKLDFGHVRTVGELKALVARFVGEAEAEESYGGLPRGGAIDGEAARKAERLIAGVIGAPSARLIVTSTMVGAGLRVDDVVRLLDESGQNLRFSRGLLAATLEAIDPGVSVIDENLRLVAWNPRYTQMFDYPEGYVTVGRPVDDLIRYNAERGECGPGEVDAHVERRLEHFRRGQPHSFERRRPSGRWIKTSGQPMPGGGYVMSFTDITAEKEAQRELEARVEARTRDLAVSNAALAEAKRAAERATRDKTRFLAAASHDLLQPLHAARLFLTALESETDARSLPLVRNIDRAIGSADNLLRALLDVSKLDAGGIVPRPERFAVAGLVEELAGEFSPLAAERGLKLRAFGGRAVVETDRSLLRSILQNLLSNAVRYTPEGAILVGVRRQGDAVRIEVRDSGPGIAEVDQRRIFREFERLESKGSAGGGVGLGLAIVERTAELLGLPIGLRSEKGRGTTFFVIVPMVGKAAPQPPRGDTATAAGPRGLTVLCLDNDPDILAGLEAALASRGCTALTAANAQVALALALEGDRPPDAALLDYRLGEKRTGLDVAAELRRAFPQLPVALVTADASVQHDPRIAALGVTLLPKPLDPDRLWGFLAETRSFVRTGA